MSLEDDLVEKVRLLPVDEQLAVQAFIEELARKRRIKGPRRDIEGLCADLNIDITEENIAEARREMWGNFPRELPKGAGDEH